MAILLPDGGRPLVTEAGSLEVGALHLPGGPRAPCCPRRAVTGVGVGGFKDRHTDRWDGREADPHKSLAKEGKLFKGDPTQTVVTF